MLPSTSKSTILSTLLLGSLSAVKAQTEGSVAVETDPTTECTYYSLTAITDLTASYPAIWDIATIPTTDTLALALYDALLPSIPNISVKGTPEGDFSNFTPTYNPDDPDCWWSYSKCTTPKITGLQPDITEVPEPDAFGLSYDDGPNCSHNAFYDFLLDNNLKATFFYIGSNVIDWPLQAQRGLIDGHEICAHTWSHRYMTALTNEEAFAELYYSKKIIKDVLGITTTCWRPPYGDVDDRIRYIANALGMDNIVWAMDTNDWDYSEIGIAAVDANYQAIIDAGTNGTWGNNGGPIVLSHELDNTTMSTAEEYLPKIFSAYKHIVPVGVAHNRTNPYVEGTIQYPSFDQFIAGTIQLSSIATPTIATSAGTISIPLSTGLTGSLIPSLAFSGSNIQATGTVSLSADSNMGSATASASASGSGSVSGSGSASGSHASSTGSSSGSTGDSSSSGSSGAMSGVKVFAGLTLGAIGGMLFAL